MTYGGLHTSSMTYILQKHDLCYYTRIQSPELITHQASLQAAACYSCLQPVHLNCTAPKATEIINSNAFSEAACAARPGQAPQPSVPPLHTHRRQYSKPSQTAAMAAQSTAYVAVASSSVASAAAAKVWTGLHGVCSKCARAADSPQWIPL